MARAGVLTAALLDTPGRCRGCGTTAYTRRELTLDPRQNWRCYWCFTAFFVVPGVRVQMPGQLT